jgi:hypothetical protein
MPFWLLLIVAPGWVLIFAKSAEKAGFFLVVAPRLESCPSPPVAPSMAF